MPTNRVVTAFSSSTAHTYTCTACTTGFVAVRYSSAADTTNTLIGVTDATVTACCPKVQNCKEASGTGA